jgi:hypothetical protein
MQHGFFKKYCDKFDKIEENKLEYTQVYNDLIDRFLMNMYKCI